MASIVIGCSQGRVLGKLLAKRLKIPYFDLSTEKFPDGETRIRFRQKLSGKKVLLVQSMYPFPNDSLVELLLATETARELGAKHVFAVVPYFAYARQDTRFNDGECVSNKIVARMVEDAGADAFITVATHLHRISSLRDIFTRIHSQNVLLGKEIADYAIARKLKPSLVVGPDWESKPLVREVALRLHCPSYVFRKQRLSGRKVKSFLTPGLDCRGKRVLLVDDIASTGNTLVSVAKILKKNGAKSVDCAVAHLLDEKGGKSVLRKGVDSLASSNSVSSAFSKIDCSQALAHAVARTDRF
ncbi:MAG: ribose-phosphate diphosphokinase [Candidatus Norongarragalinales archaeon]